MALAVEGLRELERHGGGTMLELAFEGFTALPAPAAELICWEVLGLRPGSDEAMIRATYRSLAKLRHPAAAGSDAAMSELKVARDEALQRLSA